jgi:hypothetical protein
VLGAIAILVPRFPRLKEWAYAGIFFGLTGAAASVAAVGGYGAYAFHVIAPSHYCWSYCGIVGPSTGKPYHRHPHSSDKRQAGLNTRAANIAYKPEVFYQVRPSILKNGRYAAHP